MVKIASGQLVLPLLYIKLKSKKCLKFIPVELKRYLKFIYSANKKRNIQLLKELDEIEKLLSKNNINYKFIKGADYLKNMVYDDLGERMVGDIDILINKEDEANIVKLLNNYGYYSNYEYKYWKTKHLPRFINKNKVFALEIHNEVLIYRKRKFLKGKVFLNSYDHNKILNLIILNYEINDYGYMYKTYSIKVIYDFILMSSNFDLVIKAENKYQKKFFLSLELLNIKKYTIKKGLFENYILLMSKLNKNYKFFNKLNLVFCKISIKIPIITMQLLEFILNKSYRTNVIRKIS